MANMPILHSSVPEIPGVKAGDDIAWTIRREVAGFLHRNNPNFPGAQPVSFARHHLEELCQQDYFLCEKTDGIRCLLYCTVDEVGNEIHYLIDRKNDYYFLQGLHFPHHEDKTFQRFHKDTLIDGELVVDKERDGRLVKRYLVFDCMVLDGECLTNKPLDKRMGRFDAFVHKPLLALYRAFPEEVQYFPFEVTFKKMEKPYALWDMFNVKLPQLPHGNDGLVFTCKGTTYVTGTDDHILKWKPAHENSIDFKLRLGEFPLVQYADGTTSPDYDAKPPFTLLVYYGDNRPYEYFADLTYTDQEWEIMKTLGQQLDGRIIECWRDEHKQWRFKAESNGAPRFRDDKPNANHISTVNKVIDSINDGVSQEELIAYAPKIMKAWKARHPEEVQRGPVNGIPVQVKPELNGH